MLPLFLVSAQILQIEAETGLGVGRLGIATAAFFASSAISANAGGHLVARVGARTGTRVGLFFTAAGCLVAAMADSWVWIPVAMAMAGLANGPIQVAANLAIFGGVRREHQGLAFGTKQAAIPSANVLAGLSLPVVGLVFGWRWSFLLAGIIAGMLGLLATTFVEGRRAGPPEVALGRTSPALVLLGLVGFSGAVAGNSLSLFVIPSAVDAGLSEATAGTVLAFCSALVVALRLVVGWVIDRRASRGFTEMGLLFVLGTIGGLVLIFADSPEGFLVALPIALLGAWGWTGVIFFAVVQMFPHLPARASGVILFCNLTGTLVGPMVVGVLASTGGFRDAWILITAAAGVAAVATGIVARVPAEPDPLMARS